MPEQDQSRPVVLVMDQDKQAMAKVAAQLAMAGMGCLCASDEVETLALVKSRQVDLALLRLRATYMAETDLPAVLRRISPAEYLPVMVLADSPLEQQRCRFLDSGVDDVVTETWTMEEKLARIRVLLRFKRVQDELAANRAALTQALFRERQLLARLRQDFMEMRNLATTDPLTHVQNVRSFNCLLQQEHKAAKRYGQHLSLLTLDVDHFKPVNDTHGHPAGDYVLKELAVIFKQSIRESDVVGRTGGEEFSVLLPRAGVEEAAVFAERIRAAVRDHTFRVFGAEIRVTISIGMATYPDDPEVTQPTMLAYFADQALYRAKETGRDRCVAFHDLPIDVRRRLRAQGAQRAREASEHHVCPDGACRMAIEPQTVAPSSGC